MKLRVTLFILLATLFAALSVVTPVTANASGPIPVCYPGTPRCGF